VVSIVGFRAGYSGSYILHTFNFTPSNQNVVRHIDRKGSALQLFTQNCRCTTSKYPHAVKQKGTINITKFRNIHIYVYDLNAVLYIKWREALYQVEESKQLTSNQYGSRKSKSSLDPVHIETLQLVLSRITRHAYGQINYDARTCYNKFSQI
jgi:hypothetical protein